MIKFSREIMIPMIWLMTTAANPPAIEAAESMKTGRELYAKYGCHQCHGYEGQGSVMSGSRLVPALPYEAFSEIVRRPYGTMPAYSPNILSDQALKDIYQYLKSKK